MEVLEKADREEEEEARVREEGVCSRAHRGSENNATLFMGQGR